MAYQFTCPLNGCNHTVMNSNAADANNAAEELTATAEEHLKDMHSDVHKTHEEVEEDLRGHMVKTA